MIGPNKTLPQSAYERFDYAPEALNHLQVTFAEHGDVRAGLENAIDRHELRVSSSLYKSWNRLTNGWPVRNGTWARSLRLRGVLIQQSIQ